MLFPSDTETIKAAPALPFEPASKGSSRCSGRGFSDHGKHRELNGLADEEFRQIAEEPSPCGHAFKHLDGPSGNMGETGTNPAPISRNLSESMERPLPGPAGLVLRGEFRLFQARRMRLKKG
jgi:hypothetical protein